LTLARAAGVPIVIVLCVWDFPNHNLPRRAWDRSPRPRPRATQDPGAGRRCGARRSRRGGGFRRLDCRVALAVELAL